MRTTRTFMCHDASTDPVKLRSALQLKAKLGYITGRAYWALLKSHWSDMTVADIRQESTNL